VTGIWLWPLGWHILQQDYQFFHLKFIMIKICDYWETNVLSSCAGSAQYIYMLVYYIFYEKKFKQWWSTKPLINKMNYNNITSLDRHKNVVRLNLLMGSQPSPLDLFYKWMKLKLVNDILNIQVQLQIRISVLSVS
jgi:hypothetical protein